ncbi:GNAT family N-acetyltransferase [Defluviitalea raffinosedens]|uniref:GNAT family N-acetyltransferase n=1 Tax=Defluviitalea raffinosedens TaxID=1450156 RepID=A0A7C8LJ43_9FIRM|nr:GNAT family N-acetyltransferase [Defluviitalea raffinosedens]KAE9627809.1 GNAT family N-acetyltransferase [Defluviitalea raffinosedens]
MIKKIDITNPDIAKEVLSIQIPAYQIEAKLIGFDEIPNLKDTVDSLQQCGETFYGYYMNGNLCGIISFVIASFVLDIHRLFVDPKYFRKGIARQLLDHILYAEAGFDTVIVKTGNKNIPALRFYPKYGFDQEEDLVINEQLSMAQFSMKIQLSNCETH